MPSDRADHHPTASTTTLRQRAELVRVVRELFRDRGYVEVETPLLSRDVVVDAHLEPFGTLDERGVEWFLQTSPEFHMKRLLTAGAEAIFQVARAFRREERGPLHNPEFTMVEWYRTGDTHVEQMAVVEELVAEVFARGAELTGAESAPTRPFARLSYDEAFERFAGRRALSASTDELAELASQHGVPIPPGLAADDRDGWLNLLLSEVVEPRLSVHPCFKKAEQGSGLFLDFEGGRSEKRPDPFSASFSACFVYDYPASQAALARIRDDDPPVAERFELYVAGIELCNGYHELADAAELQRRARRQNGIRLRNGRRELPVDSRLVSAMQAGLPDCAGVALGFDRLAMLALGKQSIAEVVAFPSDRA